MSQLVDVQKCVCKILDCGLLLICRHAVPFFQCEWYLSNWIIKLMITVGQPSLQCLLLPVIYYLLIGLFNVTAVSFICMIFFLNSHEFRAVSNDTCIKIADVSCCTQSCKLYDLWKVRYRNILKIPLFLCAL